MHSKVIKVGSSLGITIPKSLCTSLNIQLHSLLNLGVDEGVVVLRPLGVVRAQTRRRKSTARQAKLPTTRPRIELLRALDAWGMTKQHFQRLSHDGTGLGEFVGVVSLGQAVDPVTIERLKMCLARQETCKESWDETIDAVLLAVPERECDVDPVGKSAASGPHPTEGDGSDNDAD
jgi:antitoxin component of MazEF toxin-antitoxin module